MSSRLATVAAGAGTSPEDIGASLAALDSLCAQRARRYPTRPATTLRASLDAQAALTLRR